MRNSYESSDSLTFNQGVASSSLARLTRQNPLASTRTDVLSFSTTYDLPIDSLSSEALSCEGSGYHEDSGGRV